MAKHPAVLLETLSSFVLEVLPWGLSSLIVLYLLWGMWSAPPPVAAKIEPSAGEIVRAVPLDPGPTLASTDAQMRTAM